MEHSPTTSPKSVSPLKKQDTGKLGDYQHTSNHQNWNQNLALEKQIHSQEDSPGTMTESKGGCSP